MKIELNKCMKLLTQGYSIITLDELKRPNFSWKKYQNSQISKEEFEKQYNYSGGNTYTNKNIGEIIEIKPTNGVGLVCGYNDVEVIDIDLKVFNNLQEKQNFWNDYLGFLKSRIDDFDKKFVIFKTMNNGYHIIYRAKNIGNNQKLAVLPDGKSCVIETRGIGGQVKLYTNQISTLGIFEINMITDADRNELINISKMYNYIKPNSDQKEISFKKEAENDYQTELTPWEDYDNKNKVWDLISDEFTIVKKTANGIVNIKRNGTKNDISGGIYEYDNFLHLFTTSTQYPSQKKLTPFNIFTYKFFNGDYKSAAKDLYSKGYGSRLQKKISNQLEDIISKIDTNNIDFPLSIFPNNIQFYLQEANKTNKLSIDFMACTILWMASLTIGNSCKIKVKNGWYEPTTLWLCLVAEAGIGKSPAVKFIKQPLELINSREQKKYSADYEKYQQYEALQQNEKKNHDKVEKPVNNQFIVKDITIEALLELHSQNKNGIGVFRDELSGWLLDMNKYREGSDQKKWLEMWSNEPQASNRKTTANIFIDSPVVPVLGGIQSSIFHKFCDDEFKDSGFLDRILFSYPSLKVEHYNDEEIKQEYIDYWRDYIMVFYNNIKSIIEYDSDNEIKSNIATWSNEAKTEWVRIFNEITDIQNSDIEIEYIKSIYPKLKTYIPRFALILHIIDYLDSNNGHFLIISKKNILDAERLAKYFINNAKKIKNNSVSKKEYLKVIKEYATHPKSKQAIEIKKTYPDAKISEIASILEISRQAVSKALKAMN